jgi:hypothetical protein
MKTRLWYLLGGLVVVALCFQLFFRYDYEHLNSNRILRIDRVTQASCDMPCVPRPAPAPTATPIPYDDADAYRIISDTFDRRNEQAVELAKAAPDAKQMVAYFSGAEYQWSASRDPDYAGFLQYTKPLEKGSAAFDSSAYDWYRQRTIKSSPVLVCFCNRKGDGRYWEVHLDTGHVYSVTDNADLGRKYGLTHLEKVTP